MTAHAIVVVDLSVKLAVAGAVVWMCTWRLNGRLAARAHAAWAAILVAFPILFAAEWFLPPVWLVVPHWASARAVMEGRPGAGLPWIEVGYFSVVAAMLARMAIELGSIAAMKRRSIPVEIPPSEGAAPFAALSLAGVAIVETASLAAPATAGWPRGRLFLPSGWRESDPPVVEAALWHELAHVTRRDYAVGVAARLVVSVFWFHPIAWIAAARLRWFAELACDDAAARVVGIERYTRALLAIGRLASGRHHGLTLGAASLLAKRLELLIDSPRPPSGRVALMCAFATLVVLPITVTVRVATPPPSIADHRALHQQRHAATHHHTEAGAERSQPHS